MSEALPRLRSAMLTAVLLIGGCPTEPNRLVLTYPDQAALDRARLIELYVGEQRSCAELQESSAEPRITFGPDDGSPDLGDIAPGAVSIRARVRDAACLLFLDGCVEVVLEAGVGRTIQISLVPASGGGCAPELACVGGRCLNADAGSTDSTALDSATLDAAPADVARGDAEAPDAARSDSAMVDSALADTTLPDTALPDTTPVDGGCLAGAPCPPCYSCVLGICEPTQSLQRRRDLVVTNNAAGTVAAGCSVRFSLDTAAMVSAGALRANGDDLRLFYTGSGEPVELDRVAERPFDAIDTELWFALAADIEAGAADGDYFISYDDVAAGPAPADRDQVYLFFDDFEGGDLSRWHTDPVFALTPDQTHSGARALRVGAVDLENHQIEVRGLDEADVVAEAYFRASAENIDITLFARSTASGNYQHNLEGTQDWSNARVVDLDWQRLESTQAPHPVDQWYKLTVIVQGTQLKALVDDVQQTPASGWTEVGTDYASGSVGVGAYYIGAGETWWIDDVKVRRYVDPEPTVNFGAEEEWCP